MKAESLNDKLVLNRKTFIDPWASLPVAWSDDDRFGEENVSGTVCTFSIKGS